jgi:hypothetical protein
MNRRSVIRLLAALPTLIAGSAVAAGASVRVFKNPDCGCCSLWIKHLEAAGFSVNVTNVTDTAVMRQRFGMPEKYGGCHTATVEGYAIEGHVPAPDIGRLLAERPAAIGLSVPGMPVGSPGMEVGNRVDPYDVLIVDRAGGATVFSRYPAR